MATRTKSTAARKPAAPLARSTTAAPKAPTATAPKTVAPKPAPPKPPTPAAVEPSPVVTERARRGDLLDAMVERSPMRRADLKVVMELMLEEMGKLIDEGDELVLPPLGKLMVKKRVSRGGGGDMLTVKLKRLAPDAADEDDKD